MSAIPRDHGEPQSPHSAPPQPLLSPQRPRLDHPSHAAQLVLRAAAAGHMARCGGQRMERASLAGLSPGTSSCMPAQCTPHSRARIHPVLEPCGLQSSPFLILPPAQPRGMHSRMALAAVTARGCFARPSTKQRCCWDTPSSLPSPPGQQDSASC